MCWSCLLTIAVKETPLDCVDKLELWSRWLGDGVSGRGGEGGGEGGGYFMHNRSHRTIHPCTPTMPGRNMSGFHRPGRHRVHQARSEAFGNRRVARRVSCLLLRTNCQVEFGTLCVRVAYHMTASNKRGKKKLVRQTSRDSNGHTM